MREPDDHADEFPVPSESPWELLTQLTETSDLMELYGIVYPNEELLEESTLVSLRTQADALPEPKRAKFFNRLQLLHEVKQEGVYQSFLGAFGDRNPEKAARIMQLLSITEPQALAGKLQAEPDLMDDETIWILDLMLCTKDPRATDLLMPAFVTLAMVLQMRGDGERTSLHPAEMEERPLLNAIPGAEALIEAFFVSSPPEDIPAHLEIGDRLLAKMHRTQTPYLWSSVHQIRAQCYLLLMETAGKVVNFALAVEAYRQAIAAFDDTPYAGDRAALQFELAELLRYDQGPTKAVNREEALLLYADAARYFTRETVPLRWSVLQHAQHSIYHFREAGDRVDNLRKARAHLEEALDTYITIPPQDLDERAIPIAAWDRAMLLHEMLGVVPEVTQQEWIVADAFARQYPNPYLEAMERDS